MAAAPCRIVFMGTPEFAVPSLQALIARPDLCQVVGVVTQPDRPRGRGRTVQPSPVKACAQAHNIPVLAPKKLRSAETHAELSALGADLFLVAAYGRILPRAVLDIPPRGCINVHASLLPRWRGASPIARALWAGDAEAGVCIMGMEEGLDTGPVYARRALRVTPEETTGSLTQKLAALGAEALLEALPGLAAGQLVPTPQPNIGITHAPPLNKEDGAMNFAAEATELARRVRALDPWPGTYAFVGNERFAIMAALAHDSSEGCKDAPGTVVRADGTGLWVACAQGQLQITQVKPAGKNQMAAAAWISGRGPKMGAILTDRVG